MILRRLADAIYEQNWFTVVLEIVIVVVGIFIGLQVDDWNEARKQSALENAYLQRLLVDTDEMLAQHVAYVGRAESKIEAIIVSLDALRSCKLTPPAEAALDSTLLEHQGLERLVVVRTTYDEMVASGALARIDDLKLKSEISKVFSQAAIYQNYIDYFTTDLGRASDIIWRHVSFSIRPDALSELANPSDWKSENYTQSVIYDFDELCKVATFKNAVVEVFDSAKDRLGLGERFGAELSALSTLLVQRLDDAEGERS